MRELINLLQTLSEAAKPPPKNDTENTDDTGDEATSTIGVKAKGLFPDELKKRENFDLFINKITKGLPFTDNETGDDVFIKRSEARRMQQLLNNGQFIGKKVNIITDDGEEINLGTLRKTPEFGGSTKENVLLKPSLIKITDRDIPASDLYEVIATNPILSSTDYGRVTQELAKYIVSGEFVQLPPEYTKKDKESERKAIVDYAGEYLGVLALLYNRTRFPRKRQFNEWLGGDTASLILNFPSAANNNIADSYATIKNSATSHSLNISSKGTGGGAAPAVSGLKLSPEIKRNPKLSNAVKLIELCQSKARDSGPSTIVQAFEIMNFLYSINPNVIPKKWHKILPASPKLLQQTVQSISEGSGLPAIYHTLITDVNSKKATEGGKLVYLMKKIIARAVNEDDAIPEFADTILQVLEMNFIQQYTDYNPSGELTFATQWPAKLEGVVTLENKSSAVEPSSAGFSFKLGRNASDYSDIGPDGETGDVTGPGAAPDQYGNDVEVAAADIVNPKRTQQEPESNTGVGRKKRK
jgi:hypothetical protein